MIAAGHPDLVFDLEAFSAAMPRHWRATTDADPFAPVRSFGVGQLVHLRSSLERLAQRVKGPIWPEYAELDCFACHHSLTRPEDSWRQATGYADRRPGNPAYNLSRWTTARHVLRAFDAGSVDELTGIMTSIAREASRLRVDPNQVATLVGTGARHTRPRHRPRSDITARRRDDHAAPARIASEADDISIRGERAAEQAAMAMETLYTATAHAPAEPGRPRRVRRTVPAVPEPEQLRPAPLCCAGAEDRGRAWGSLALARCSVFGVRVARCSGPGSLGIRLASLAVVLVLLAGTITGQNTPSATAGGPAQILTAADVDAVIQVAASRSGQSHSLNRRRRSHRRDPRCLRAAGGWSPRARCGRDDRARGGHVRQRPGAAVFADGSLHQWHPLPTRRQEHAAMPRSTVSRTSIAAAR